jgi:phosphatidylinositol-3-phosphatase
MGPAWRRLLGGALVTALTTVSCEQRTVLPAGTVAGRGVPGVSGPFGHVFILVEENANYSDVIGDSAMPYLNSLAGRYGLATQYYANAHPSIGNYFMITVGDTITNDDGYSGIVSDDNVVRRLVAAGKTWKSYAEDLPSVGYTGAGRGKYARKHNVFALLSDVAQDAAQQQNLVPFSQLPTDLATNALPDYAFIVPNLCNDAHDCPLRTADTWLKSTIDPLVRSATFQRDGLLIIVFDESRGDGTHGGGRIACVIVSPKAKRGYQSRTLYQHQSLLRLSLKALGVKAFPNAAASAPDMDEFFAFRGGQKQKVATARTAAPAVRPPSKAP